MALREVRALFASIDTNDAAAVAEVIVEGIPAIAERYGLAAATLAADWYETVREAEEAPGSFVPIIPPPPPQARWEAMAGWIRAGDKTAVEQLVSGGLQRTIADMHRGTVMESAVGDPAAQGWARFAKGAETCGFCLLLVSRGGVYTDATAKFGAHDHCDCTAGPIFKGARAAKQVAAYQKSARRRENAQGEASESYQRDMARAREWMRDNGLI